ncbi:hypothetical protein CAEBREN_05506 [Caenorhabditis brenneri]|uniref:Uncharacterized protein n=1 Tax=Caenorhabditis brenneri TaxID=135651 RepID=G0MA68_CAEBE|nr:hypothetical protein CAEBREN_05506 [Caenorhabditis brenneri]
MDFPEKSYSRGISENFFGILCYIKEFDPNQPSDYSCENEIPKFFQHLKQALVSKSWNNLYQMYRFVIDIMITSARSQEIIDLRIAWGSKMYETFEERDMAMRRRNDGCPILGKSSSRNVDTGTVVLLPVTTAMIDCFHECTTKVSLLVTAQMNLLTKKVQGDYKPVFKNFLLFFECLKENLCTNEFAEMLREFRSPLYTAIVKETKFLLNFIFSWDPNTTLPGDEETINPDLYINGFFPSLVSAMQARFRGRDRAKRRLNQENKTSQDSDSLTGSGPSQPLHETVLSKMYEVQQSETTKVNEISSTRATEFEDIDVAMFSRGSKNRANHQKLEEKLSKKVEKEPSQPIRESVPSKTYEVRHAVPIEVPTIKEASSTRVPEVHQTTPCKVTEVKETNKVPLEPNEANQQEGFARLESILQKFLKEQLDLFRSETDRKLNNLENLNLEENLKKNLKNHFDQQLNQINASCNKKFDDLSDKYLEIDGKIDKAMNNMKEQWEKKMEEMKLMKTSEGEDFTQVLVSVDKKFDEQEQKLKLREEKLERKMEELKLKEYSVNEKMEEMKTREDSLDKKMEAMIEKSVKEQKQQFELSKVLIDRKMEAAIEKSFENQEEKIQLKDKMLEKKIETMIGRSGKEQEEKWKLEAMEIIEDSLAKKMEALIEKSVQEQSKLKEDFLIKKVEEMRVREELNKKMREIIGQSVQEQKDQLKLKGDLLNKKMEEIKIEEESLNKKVEAMIEERVQEHEEKLKLKEDSLNIKLKEMKILEDSLGKKMEEMIEKSVHEQKEQLKLKEEVLDKKIEEVKSKEELLDRKIDAMIELMKVFEQPSYSGSLPTADHLDDEELRQIQESFEKQLADQEARQAAEMEELKERGRQKKEKARGEIRELTRSVSRARERASFRL